MLGYTALIQVFSVLALDPARFLWLFCSQPGDYQPRGTDTTEALETSSPGAILASQINGNPGKKLCCAFWIIDVAIRFHISKAENSC